MNSKSANGGIKWNTKTSKEGNRDEAKGEGIVKKINKFKSKYIRKS